MHKSKKTIGWLFGITGFLLVLLLVSALLAPRLINLEKVRKAIEQKFSQDIGGKLAYREIDLSYFPSPHVIIRQVTLSLPNDTTGEVAALHVYPKILPLLRGSLQLNRFQADEPVYTIRLSERIAADEVKTEPISFTKVFEEIHDVILSFPEFILPGVNVQLKDGSLNVLAGARQIFNFRDIQAFYRRPATTTEFSIRCASNLWQSIFLSGWLETKDFKSSGTLRLTQFQPQRLSEYFFPDSDLQMTDAPADLNIEFETDGPQRLQANLYGSVPYLKFVQGPHQLVIKCEGIEGVIQLNKNKATVILNRLGLDYPKLDVSGKFFIDESQPLITLDLEGRQIDATATRNVVLALIDKSQVVKNIFRIIRGGKVPQITFNTHGRRIADLANPDNIVIRGQMLDGKIFIPGAELNLEKVQGTAVISDSMLEGSDLKAQMGKTSGQNGKLKLDFNDDKVPFHLEIMVQADLTQLPPVLERLIEDKIFLAELARIEAFNGTASGKLILGTGTKRLNIKVEASDIHLNALYQRIPYLLKIDGGQFFFDGLHIRLTNFDVKLGKSLFSQLSSTLSWEKTAHLKLATQTARCDLDELYRWFLTFDNLNDTLKKIEPIKGNLALQHLEFKGPISMPMNRQLNVTAQFNPSVLTSKLFPGSLSIAGGQLSWRGAQIRLENLNGGFGKSTFSQLSAGVDWNRAATLSVTAEFVKIFLDEIYPWLLSVEKLPKTLKQFSATKGSLALHGIELKGPLSGPDNWQFTSTGDMDEIVVESELLDDPVTITTGKFIFAEKDYSGVPRNCIKVGSTHVTWGESHFTFTGDLCILKNTLQLDLDVNSDGIEWIKIKNVMDNVEKSKDDSAGPSGGRHLQGMLRIKSGQFKYERYVWRSLQATMAIESDEVTVNIESADLCGISTPGLLKAAGDYLEYHFVPFSKSQELKPTLSCLFDQKAAASGKFSFDGELMAKTEPDASLRAISGEFQFSAEKGRIYRLGLLAKIFAILNVTEIYRGEVPDLVGEGFAYNTIIAKADSKGGKLILKECFIDGVSMGIVTEGQIDLVEKKINLVVLVAPFKTLDRIIKKIPIISGILGGKLISIPFRAIGDIDNYQVIPLSPTAVGAGILGIMERTLKLPIKIIQPLFPQEKKEEEKKDPQQRR